MWRADQLDADRACVLLVDLQEKLVPLIRDRDRVVIAARKMLEGADLFHLPVLCTEQYVRGLGKTIPDLAHLAERASATVVEKAAFSAWAEPNVRRVILAMDRPQVIVTGVETHVCVQQAALDLIARDYSVFVCADAVGARGALDHQTGLERMRHAGVAVTTVESALFELCQRCDTSVFKRMIEVVKRFPPGD